MGMSKKLGAILLSLITVSTTVFTGCSTSKTTNLNEKEEGSSGSNEVQQVKKNGKTKITAWGINTLAIGSGNKEMVEEFNKTHDTIELVAQSTPKAPGYETQDLTKLTAAIAAGNAPDIAILNAPFIMEVASRNVLEPLSGLIEKTGFDINQFYEYTIKEMTFDGEIWGIPNGVDTRFLYYNKKLFEEAGLDPDKPPTTWDELLEYAEILTKKDDKGDLTQIGFIPNFGNSWLYLYLLQNGGQMVTDDGLKCTLNSPEVVEALEFMVEGYDLLGGGTKVNSYVTAFSSQSGANDPFLTGKVAMIIQGNWGVGTYGRYGKEMLDDIGYTYAPTPTGEDFITWSGGWAYGIPKGCKNPEETLETIAWLATQGAIASSKGASKYNQKQGLLDIPQLCASKEINEQLFEMYVTPMENQNLKEMIQFGMDILDVSYSLPVHPVGQFIWAEHARAIDNAIYKKMTPQQALDEATTNCQKEIDKFWGSYKPTN